MIRQRQWQYVCYRPKGKKLDDLATDPHEFCNHASAPAAMREDLRRQLAAHLQEIGDPFALPA